MKRSKAFILVEILTGMVLQAGFIIVLCTSFYLMLSFYTRTQQTLSARQKAEKVIAYVDARIKHAGLGLQECKNSSEIRDALFKVTNLLESQKLTLPVAITSGDWKFREKDSNGKFKGNRLTLLFTERASGLKLIIRTIESPDLSGYNDPMILSSDKDATANGISVDIGFILKSKNGYNQSEFNKNTSNSTRILYLNSYAVMAGTGRPLYVGPVDTSKGTFGLYLFSQSSTTGQYTANIYPGDELLYLKCERMLVEGENFRFWRYGESNNWDDKKKHPHEEGILEIYFELDTTKNILDMYVLASGGNNDLRNTQKPSAWPGTWKSEYANYIVYMSCASWKLHNIHFDTDLTNHGWN